MPSSVDVVIVAYNRWDLTASCLRHLEAQTIAHQVIVMDNGSTDDTRERLRTEWPAVRLVCAEENQGFPKACNRGVAAGAGELVVLLNNDVDCRPDFLERLVDPFGDPMVGSVAGLLLMPDEQRIDGMGLATDVTLAAFPRLRGLPIARAREATPVLLGPGGASAAYRRSAWEQVGGLDEAIDFYMEDFDLALRLRIAGWRAVAEPDAVGVHLGSATHGHRSASSRRYGGYGRGYMLGRYGLLRTPSAPRTITTEVIAVLGDLLMSRDLVSLRGRLAGWHAARAKPRLDVPLELVDQSIGFLESLTRRWDLYGLGGTS